jgi:DNA-binding PadR family transcriptional regulator
MAISNVLLSASALEELIVERYVKTSLDIVVLAILNGKPTYGYKIIAAVHKEFGILLSPGSLYPLLHSLEEKRFIESRFEGGKIVYMATPSGKRRFQNAFEAYKRAVCTFERFIERHGEGIL